jgi:3-deoxy-7-phosphoheptulonate synthase
LHRELASGLSCPVGFKNGTDGNLRIAVDALRAAREPHHFLSITKEGHSAIFSTTGNEDCHMILRGGKEPNYDAAHVERAAKELSDAGLSTNIMIDLSHANSRKQHEAQAEVCADVAAQVAAGDYRLFGVMIEGHLIGGRQDVKPDQPLVYGQSITDACLSWEASLPLLDQLAEAVRKRRTTVKATARV